MLQYNSSHCTPIAIQSVVLQYNSSDECLKHSYYTRVGLSFSRLFYSNFIVFVARLLIWCLVWMQVHWSEKSNCWKQFLEQWGAKLGSDCHVTTSQRRDVPTSRHPNVMTSGQQCKSQQVETSRRCNVATSARDLHLII